MPETSFNTTTTLRQQQIKGISSQQDKGIFGRPHNKKINPTGDKRGAFFIEALFTSGLFKSLDCMETLNQQRQKADRLAAITQRIGFTLWQLQELEGVAAQYFVLLAQAKKEMGLAAGNALVEKAQNKTFGTTIHQIAKAGLLSSGLELRFNNLLSERNWLVHKSRRTNRNAIHSDSAAQKLLLRVNSMADESNALLREIGVLVERYVKEHGVTEKYIEETANQLLEQWHASDAI